MNIKGLIPTPITAVDAKPKVEGKRMHNAGDRDGNGKREQPEPEAKRNLNQQEFDEALKTLAEMPGLKSNNLNIKVEVKDGVRVILITDGLGATVRRLSEQQLWASTRDKDRQTGKILDKAM